ncbi:MAG: signal peptide peptidase SppA [Actinomycetota bacterium]|nr:signal peptide peptidase SppA [Actinomycetota bacterium]
MTDAPALRRRKRWPMALGLGGLVVWVAALVAGVVILFATASPVRFNGASKWDEDRLFGSGTDKVALIKIQGEIVPGEGGGGGVLGRGSLGSDDYVSQLRQALEDDDVQSVVIRLDTPGGSVVASDDVYRMVRLLRSRGKHVVASMGDVAASGGYYIASACDAIIANRATITGSIGVIAMFLNLEGTAKKIGAKPVVIKSGPHKDIGSPFRELTAEERAILQKLIDEAYLQFLNAVADGRGMPVDQVRRIADGRVLSGAQAKDAHLVDDFGDVRDAYLKARDLAGITRARFVEYVPPGIGLGSLLGGKVRLGDEIRSAVREAGADLTGLPTRPGLEYLWVQ